MPYEIIISQADDLSVETIGFGEDQAKAERIFDFTTNTLMRDGHILIGNIQHPKFVEVVRRGGPAVMFIELRYQPTWDIGNILALFTLLALEAINPRALSNGLVKAEVVKAEQRWATAQYVATETTPKGSMLKHALVGDRQEALKAYVEMVGLGKKKVQLCPDGVNKYAVFDDSGITTWEFQERPAK